MQVNLITPMILTAGFVRLTEGMTCRRKVINISSGTGTNPLSDMSVYCASKAGMNMFTRVVGLEQENAAHPVEIIAVNPGMVETDMQKLARAKDDNDFAMAPMFRQAQEAGRVHSTEVFARHFLAIIDRRYEQGQIVSCE